MCSLATCYKGKRLCLHSLHFQQLPSFQLPWSIQIKLQIKTFFLEWGPQGVACHSNAISVITCSELGRESQILNMWSCPFNPSQCPRNASISEPTSPTQKKKKKLPRNPLDGFGLENVCFSASLRLRGGSPILPWSVSPPCLSIICLKHLSIELLQGPL